MPSSLRLTDVTLRDGLQAEAVTLTLEQKLSLFDALVKCGFQRLEVASFVHPKWVPQLADSEAFCKKLLERSTLPEMMAFVPNEKGLERCLQFPISWVSTFVAASETFNQKNVNMTISETLTVLAQIVSRAKKENRKVRVYLSTAFGCPYEGDMKEDVVVRHIQQIAQLGADEIALSDTIGVAAPSRVESLCQKTFQSFAKESVALHLHDTYGMALANVSAGYHAGVTSFDGSLGGIGGCPYAKGATGNVASESLQYLFLRDARATAFPWNEVRAVHSELKRNGLKIHSQLNELAERGGNPYGIV